MTQGRVACAHLRMVAIVSILVLVGFVLPRGVDAAHTGVPGTDMTGWAWSSVAGWISMSSTNCVVLNTPEGDTDPCVLTGIRYGVVIDEQGAITGYAWSRTVGWVCFGATCTGTPPRGTRSARVDVLANPHDITGWAKVVAAGTDGWVSLSCLNHDACGGVSAYRTTWVPPVVDGGVGSLEGFAWNGASVAGGSALGWVRWQTAFAGTETMWQPVDLCASNKNQCSTHDACVLPGEYCCPAGSPCGQCDGNGAQCSLNTDCAQGVICCLPGEQCGRCVNNGLACGEDADCRAEGFDETDACCPPGTVCTRAGDTTSDTAANAPGVVGFCQDTVTACVDAAQCGDVAGACVTDSIQGLCDEKEAATCSTDRPCASGQGQCKTEVGLCTVNADGVPVPCLSDGYCAIVVGAGVTCVKIIGICTDDGDKRLCVDDTNCSGTNRCEKLYLPWLQALYGPIYSTKGVGSPQTAPAPVGKYNATYCILAGGPVVNFLSAEGCGTVRNPYDALIAPGQSPTISKVARIDVGGIMAGRYGDIVEFLPTGPRMMLGGKVYRVVAPADATSAPEFILGNNGITFTNGVGKESGAGLIVIRGGNLHIIGNIAYEDAQTATLSRLASVGFLVLKDGDLGGNITIDPDVTQLAGAFYAEGTISTGTNNSSSTEKPLRVRGVMIAKEFKFQRSHGSIEPAEQILADGRVLVNTPPGFGDVVQSLPLIRQVVP